MNALANNFNEINILKAELSDLRFKIDNLRDRFIGFRKMVATAGQKGWDSASGKALNTWINGMIANPDWIENI